MYSLIELVSQVSDVAHGPLVTKVFSRFAHYNKLSNSEFLLDQLINVNIVMKNAPTSSKMYTHVE